MAMTFEEFAQAQVKWVIRRQLRELQELYFGVLEHEPTKVQGVSADDYIVHANEPPEK